MKWISESGLRMTDDESYIYFYHYPKYKDNFLLILFGSILVFITALLSKIILLLWMGVL